MYDRNTCIQVLSTILVQVLLFPSPQLLNSIDYDYFSVLLWSFNEIVFLFKES